MKPGVMSIEEWVLRYLDDLIEEYNTKLNEISTKYNNKESIVYCEALKKTISDLEAATRILRAHPIRPAVSIGAEHYVVYLKHGKKALYRYIDSTHVHERFVTNHTPVQVAIKSDASEWHPIHINQIEHKHYHHGLVNWMKSIAQMKQK